MCIYTLSNFIFFSYVHILNALALKYARDGAPAQYRTASFDPTIIAKNICGKTPLSSQELLKEKLTRF